MKLPLRVLFDPIPTRHSIPSTKKLLTMADEAPPTSDSEEPKSNENASTQEIEDTKNDVAEDPSSSQVRMKAHTVLAKVKQSEDRRGVTATSLEAEGKSTPVPPVTEEIDTAATKAAKEHEIAKKKKESSEELTKRLQNLALERQKENRHETLRVIQSDETSHLHSAKTFQELKLPEFLLKAIFEMGFERPSAIQEEALPRILANPPRNVIGQVRKWLTKMLGSLSLVVYQTKTYQIHRLNLVLVKLLPSSSGCSIASKSTPPPRVKHSVLPPHENWQSKYFKML